MVDVLADDRTQSCTSAYVQMIKISGRGSRSDRMEMTKKRGGDRKRSGRTKKKQKSRRKGDRGRKLMKRGKCAEDSFR